jgi:LytR cell envelope-related transcriptional attenuator
MHLVQEIGSYAGFAAVVGLAVLSALYFSQARDVKRLREWAGRAPERAAEEEARIAAQAQAAQAQAQQQRAAASAGGATVAAPAVRPQTASTPPPSGVPAPPPPTLPSARPAAATGTPILSGMRPPEPWYRRIHWPAPRYIALIVVGILVIGAGAAYGISQLTNNGGGGGSPAASQGSSSSSGSGSSTSKHSHKVASMNPKSITVAVLNGTTVTGLAATVADKVEQEGFRRGNTNNALTQGQQAESVVEYADGNVKAAELVGKKLGIAQVEKIDPQTQGLAGDATVTVIVGADKAGGAGTSG